MVHLLQLRKHTLCNAKNSKYAQTTHASFPLHTHQSHNAYCLSVCGHFNKWNNHTTFTGHQTKTQDNLQFLTHPTPSKGQDHQYWHESVDSQVKLRLCKVSKTSSEQPPRKKPMLKFLLLNQLTHYLPWTWGFKNHGAWLNSPETLAILKVHGLLQKMAAKTHTHRDYHRSFFVCLNYAGHSQITCQRNTHLSVSCQRKTCTTKCKPYYWVFVVVFPACTLTIPAAVTYISYKGQGSICQSRSKHTCSYWLKLCQLYFPHNSLELGKRNKKRCKVTHWFFSLL